MKINENIINDIFNLKIKLTNKKDKIALSKYEDLIPMYDIYTQTIIPVKKNKLYNSLIYQHYRFVNDEVFNWILLLVDKYKDRVKKADNENKEQMETILNNLNKMVKIMENYDLETLINNSYKVLYQNSTSLGLTVSICKRNSFNPFIFYLKPYYTKIELIKLGQNMGIMDKNTNPEKLIDVETHYEVCKKISNNDVSFDEIKNHTIEIYKNNTVTDIVFYSFIGASLLNRFLRTSEDYELVPFYYNVLKNIVNTMAEAPALENNYQMYRFISDDDFLTKLKVGDTFVDKGFLSTTRDPFYSSGTFGTFGMVLIKINFKKNIKGAGLFIEHYSLFQKEEEFLVPPFSKLKLVSKDDNFKYYHTNEDFEKKINKKYEFDFEGIDYSWFKSVKQIEEDIPRLDFKYLKNTDARSKIDLFNKIKQSSNKFNELKILNTLFYAYYFDSTQAYRKFYYNKIEKGLTLIHFDENHFPILSIELGKELVVNYLNIYYLYNKKDKFDEDKLFEILVELGYLLGYKKAKIFHEHNNFIEFKNNYFTNQEIFLTLYQFNNTIYQYLKNNKKTYNAEPFYKDNLRELDLIVNNPLTDELKNKFNFYGKNIKELIIEVIEKRFYQYQNLIKILEIDKFNYGEFNISEKLSITGRSHGIINLEYSREDDEDELFRLTYRQPIRRNY